MTTRTMPSISTRPTLDEYQQRVIDATERSIRVVAPAGSGKTETLARRVEERIRQGIPANRILVLTFDRNAADSFRAKLRSGNGGPTARVETLNAYGYGLLRNRFPDERNRIVSEPFWPATNYLNELVNEYGHQVFSSMLSKIKNEVFDPRSVNKRTLSSWIAKNRVHLLRDLDNEQIVAKVDDSQFGRDLATEYIAYEKFLEQRKGIDFDDQKLRPLIRLREDPAILDSIRNTLDEVIVDEFQDINKLDCELIDAISTNATLVVTGDDDQAIYGFRGASAEYLISPKGAFGREFTHYELSINYRCPPKVIDVAGKLITHNGTRIPKKPKASKALPGTVEAMNARNADVEALTVAHRAGSLLRDPDGSPRTVAILTRTNAQLLEIQSALIRAETPYTIGVENDVRITWELARRMLVVAPELKKRGIPEAETRATVIECFAKSRRLQPNQVNALKRMAIQDELNFPGPEMLQLLPDRLRVAFESGLRIFKKAKDLADRLVALEDMLHAIPSQVMNGGRRTNQPSRLGGMIDLAESFGERQMAFLEEVDRLISIQREALRRDTVPKVALSTCHGAKGREWQVVLVPFCNEGIFPDARSEEGEYLEAERKLFYVSMTRASEHLVLSWADFRPDTGRKQAPSPFLIEAGLAKPPPQQRSMAASTTPSSRPSPSTTARREQRNTPPRVNGTSPSRRPVSSPAAVSTTVPAPVAAPKSTRLLTLISVRGRMVVNGLDPKKVNDLASRIVEDEQRNDLAFADMTLRYQAQDPDATLPLQMDLALRGVPFAVRDEDHFSGLETFDAMCDAWLSGSTRVTDESATDTIAAMEAVLTRATGSTDHKRWRAALDRISDEEPGTDPEGVQFTAG
jgi:DNA helicase-2/ATP-dependent DNA helicase PcrA